MGYFNLDGLYVDFDWKEGFKALQADLDTATHIVLFNAKFDWHWLRKVDLNLDHLKVWDCQYAEFLFSNQQIRYPSLEDTAVRYGLGHKIDVVKEEFWNKGIDTLDIPPEIMVQYLYQDVNLTKQIFEIQQELFRTTEKDKYRLFLLHMEDCLVLEEMEWNGIHYDAKTSLEKAQQIEVKLLEIENELRLGYDGIPINFDSGDHLSVYLYGGAISVDTRVPVGVFKSGAKTGQPRYKIVTHEYKVEGLVKPLPKSELKKEGYYATNEDTLKQLKGNREAKKRISLLLERAKLEKLRGTYFQGLPTKIVEMGWPDNYLHPNYNQCTVVTGRLSSTNPNGQNMSPEVKQLCTTRFGF